ncbi:MAG: GTPase Era [Treponema sp.]|jgi:GTP-binding protein Era|nr:GTPase Era [Treponema sp.]
MDVLSPSVQDAGQKAAFVAVAGRPSAGKSTLINLLCGEKVSIVSPVPQTTRNAIRGIVNREQGQLVLVDTPGIHISEKKLNLRLTETAVRALGESDLVLYVLDASRAPGPEEEAVAAALASRAAGSTGSSGIDPSGSGLPDSGILAAINKMDLPGADYDRALDFLRRRLPALPDSRCFPVSAKKNEGVTALLDTLFELAPRGPSFYPAEYYTDQEIDFRVAEIIRGEAIKRLREELPHAFYVEVADREFRNEGKRLWVRAFIICERESQKGMIVGKGGSLIKAIGEAARKELNRVFDWKFELDLRVKTGKDWRHNDRILRKILG